MSRHRSMHPAIQLFPFLAVLVSVMGALIFLLLVTSKRIPQVAVARARAAQTKVVTAPAQNVGPVLSIPELESSPTDADFPEMPLADLDEEGPSLAELEAQKRDAAHEAEQASLIDQWRRRIKTMQGNRDEVAANVERQKLLMTAAERQQLKMLAELQELERKLGSLTGKITAGSMHAGHADRERIQLEQRILGLRRQLKLTADQQRVDSGKYSIVPFDGKSGTTRRPILIECTSTGFRFVPEDVAISAADIEGFTERQNPLLAGAAALTQYWNQVNQEQGGATPDTQPYVLLIVRPSGTLGYYVSVRLLAALKQQHGYELVAEDVDLKWPAVNAGAQAACRAAVQTMLAQRDSVALNPNGVPSSGEPGIGGGRGGAGVAGRASNGTGGSPGNRTAIGNGGTGRPGGGTGTGQRKGFELSDLDPPSNEVGDRSWEDPSRFGGLEHRRDKTKATGNGNSGNGASAGGNIPRGNSGGRTPGNAIPAEGRSDNETGEPIANESNRAVPVKTTSSTQPNWTARPTSTQRVAPHPDTAAEPTDDGPSPTTSELPAGSTAPRNSSVAAPMVPRPTGSRPTGGQGGQRPPRNVGSPPNGEQRLARGPKRGNGQDIPYEMLQHRRWGHFEEGANIGLEKPVTILVDAEQIIVADQLIIPIRPGASRNELFDQLLAAIDENSATWGKAAAGFFWVPSLRFIISPGGNQIYDRLAPLVIRSGLRADTEFTLERPQALLKGGRP